MRFTPERARRVASERWHGNQEGAFLADGRYELRVPYTDDRQRIMHMMEYGGDCELVEPEALRARVAAEFAVGLARYGSRSCSAAPLSVVAAQRAASEPAPARGIGCAAGACCGLAPVRAAALIHLRRANLARC